MSKIHEIEISKLKQLDAYDKNTLKEIASKMILNL